MILLDTNPLAYAVNTQAPQYTPSRAVVQAAVDGHIPGVLVAQVLLEFFAVVTSPRRVQHPLDARTAWAQVAMLRTALPVLDLRSDTMAILGELIQTHRPIGADVFDLHLAAQMRAHSVATICTYNVQHFSRLPQIEALTPNEVLVRYGIR